MLKLKRLTASFLIVCLTSLGMPMHAFAGIISTEEATVISNSAAAEREKIVSFLSRDDIRKSLEDRGVSSQAAIDRVNTLSDAEVQQLAADIDNAPAGADVLGILFTIFVVLLITDILGFTKVFPFTRSIR